MPHHSAPSAATIAQQLENLVNMAERVATPGFKQGFRAFIRARAGAANSSLTYRNEQGQLVREWPSEGTVEILAEPTK